MATVMDFNGFRLEIDEITQLVFNRPKVNVFSTAVLEDFVKALDVLYTTKYIKVLVITAEGATFLAGADIAEMSSFGPREAAAFSRLFHRAMDMVEGFPRPVVAGVNGFALGGGCELALACDIVLASEVAVFGQPEIALGVIPGAGGTKRLAERVGKIFAKELIFTGRKVFAHEAHDLGLVNKVAPKDRFKEELGGLARSIASRPLQCLEAAKALINAPSAEKETESFSRMFSFEDQKALMGDFLRKK